MGSVPLLGAVGIVLGGVVWYRLYGRERTEREGAALDALRRRTASRRLDQTAATLEDETGYRFLVPVTEGMSEAQEAALLRVAATVVHHHGGTVQVVQFERVPEQTPLSPLVGERMPEEVTFEETTRGLADDFDLAVEVAEVATHDVNRAIVNFAAHEGTGLILTGWQAAGGRLRPFGGDADWLMTHAPCGVVFVEDRGLEAIEEVAVVADVGPMDPTELVVAGAMAAEAGARLRFVNALGPEVTDVQVDSVRAYHDGLASVCAVPTKSEILRTDEPAVALAATVGTADPVVMAATARRHLSKLLFGSLQDALVTDVDSTVALIHAGRPRRHTFLRGLLERVAYRT